MNAGKLRNLIRIEQKSFAAPSGSSGEMTGSWTLLQNQYAAIHPLSGKELAFAQSVTQTATYKITTRYVAALVGVEPVNFRVVWNGRLFAVNAILEGDLVDDMVDCRSRWLTLLCSQYYDPQDSESLAYVINSTPIFIPT